MSQLILQPTAAAHWHSLIQEAEDTSHMSLTEDLESYLVFLLIRFTGKPEIAKSVLALEFLTSSQALGANKREGLRNVGDQCLLFAGLFPDRAQHKRVQISYFVELGQTAYTNLAELYQQQTADLFAAIGKSFVSLMDILHIIRENSADHTLLTPLQAEELWTATRSPHAFKTLRYYTSAQLLSFPEPALKKNRH